MRSTAWRLGLVLFAAQFLVADVLAQYATVARRGGDPAPGTGGIFYTTLGVPGVNLSCDAAFEATLNTSLQGNQGAWVGNDNLLQLIALNDDVAPGTGGAIFGHVSIPVLTPGGEFLLPGQLRINAGIGIDSTNNAGLWAGSVGALQLLLQKGAAAPDLAPGIVFNGPWVPNIVANSPTSGALTAAVHIDLTGTGVSAGNDNGIWAGTPGDLRLVVRSGDPAPGFPAGHIYSQASVAAGGAGPVLNANGVLGFWGRADSGVNVVWAAWTGPRNDPQPILRTGDTASNMPAGFVFEDLGLASINLAGSTAGQGTISEPIGIGRRVIWRQAGGVTELLKIQGDPVPGLPAGVVWGDVELAPAINANDAVIFESALAGTGVTSANDRAIIIATAPDSLTIAAREGDQAPGLGAGVLFQNFQASTLVLNADDEAAFSARLTGAGVTAANDRALFAGAPGALVPVVREGDTIEVAPGVFETVSSFSVLNLGNTGNQDGRYSYFNDVGQVAFLAFFTSGRNGVLTWPGNPCTGGENLPPEITSAPVTTAELGVLYTYDVEATDPNGDALTFSLDESPIGMFIDATTGIIQWTPLPGQQGLAHDVVVRVADPDGLFVTQAYQVQVGSPNAPPVITSTPPLTATEGVPYVYDVDATDPDGDTLTYAFGLNPPSGMTIDPATGLIEWTPGPLDVGAFIFVFVVVDDGNGGSDSQAFDIVVAAGNAAPAITSVPPVTATEGSLYTYDVEANDPDGDTLTFSLDLAPAGMSIDPATGLISWTPGAGQLGDNTVTVRVADPGGLAATQSFTIDVSPSANQPPVLADVDTQTIDEGDAIALSVAFTDTDSTSWTAIVDFGDGAGPQPATVDPLTMSVLLDHVYVDDGVYPVIVTVTDDAGAFASTAFDVVVNNAAPVLSNLVVDPVLVAVDSETVWTTVDFADPGAADTHVATIDWGDGTVSAATVNETGGAGVAFGDHVYAAPGVYTVMITVTDDDGAEATESYQFVVAYDPSGGFVTGGGWIDSPAGACQLTVECSTLTGKANFGFVSKYKNGASVPSGNTSFHFAAGELQFKSTSYEWLVVSGHSARYKGEGSINGQGNYGFIVFATDASLTPSTDVDLLRIKIWDKNNGDYTVYDNEMGAAEDWEATMAIAQGSIVIHKSR